MIKRSYFGERFWIKTDRWPWHKRGTPALLTSDKEAAMKTYGWRATDGTGRFGGGWNYELGFQFSGIKPTGWTLYFTLLLGTLSFSYVSKLGLENQKRWEREAEERRAKAAADAEESARRHKEWQERQSNLQKVLAVNDEDDIPF